MPIEVLTTSRPTADQLEEVVARLRVTGPEARGAHVVVTGNKLGALVRAVARRRGDQEERLRRQTATGYRSSSGLTLQVPDGSE
jgi:hypothetical protein